MKLRWILSSLFLISCASHQPQVVIEASPLARESEQLVREIVQLSIPNRSVGSAGHKKVFEYLRSEFEKIAKSSGGRTFVHEFRPDVKFAIKNYEADFENLVAKKLKPESEAYQKWYAFTKTAIKFVKSYERVKGRNLVLELPGAELAHEVIYVGAHFDTITHDHKTMTFTPQAEAPGADDNASGVAAILTAARALSQQKHKRTVRFVAFDFEEIFFLGSYAFAKDLVNGRIPKLPKFERNLGLLNLEMVGWSTKSPNGKSVVKVYTRDPKSITAEETHLAHTVRSKASPKLEVQILGNGFNRSDNWPFWENGLNAITISEDWEGDFNEKNYHTVQDTPESLNYAYLGEITSSLVNAVEVLAN